MEFGLKFCMMLLYVSNHGKMVGAFLISKTSFFWDILVLTAVVLDDIWMFSTCPEEAMFKILLKKYVEFEGIKNMLKDQ